MFNPFSSFHPCFHPLSPGSCFWLQRGTVIYNRLVELIRKHYAVLGYLEVITPNIYLSKLWQISGHWDHYKDAMFSFGCEDEEFALKPMNCPGHCLLFKSQGRSYRNLPIRFAEFGVLHRNELSGALHGLTRVRRFVQDDSHIYCTEAQIEGVLAFMRNIYDNFKFDISVVLSTRNEKKYMGDLATRERAENTLRKVLTESKSRSASTPATPHSTARRSTSPSRTRSGGRTRSRRSSSTSSSSSGSSSSI